MSERPKLSLRSFGLIGLLGGVGGAINAWSYYSKITIFSVPSLPPDFSTDCLTLLAGAAHGGLLAVIPLGFVVLLWKSRWVVRLSGTLIVGVLSGWLSGVPMFILLRPPSSWDHWWGPVAWPLALPPPGFDMWRLFLPLEFFGFVGLLYFFFLNICRQLTTSRLFRHLLMGSLSGSLGSLTWWIFVSGEPWYIAVLWSFLHGTIWGSLVGFGVWKAQQSSYQAIEQSTPSVP